MQVSLRYWFAFLWIYPAVLGSLDHTVVLFLIFWGNIYTVFYSSCTILHSQQCTRIPFSLHLHWHLLSRLDESHSDRCKVISPCGFDCCLVLMRAILTVVRWYLLVDLICIFLISIILNIFSYTCCPFVCLLLIIVYSFVHFSNSAFLLSYRSSLYVLDITSSLGTVGRHSNRPAGRLLIPFITPPALVGRASPCLPLLLLPVLFGVTSKRKKDTTKMNVKVITYIFF